MSVRTYNPSVRVGNWNEDICLKEVLYNTSRDNFVKFYKCWNPRR